MIYIILGIILTVLFFLNIKSAASVLCRVIGGFAFLLIYNSVALKFSFPATGINIISAAVCGVLGAPGGLLLLALTSFL